MPHCLVLVCHHLPHKPPVTVQPNLLGCTMPTHTQCCQRCWMVVFVVCHGCMLVLQHTWCHGQSPPPLCVVAILCHHATPSMSSTPNHVNRCAMCGCGASCPHTSQTCLLHALHGVCGGVCRVLVHTGLDATPPVVHTMGCNALVCCHQCLCVVCALPSIVSTTTTTLVHHWGVGVCVVAQHQVSVVVGLFVG